MNKTTKKIAYCAVLSAMAIVLVYFIHFPIFPAMSFLEYDMGDIPLFVGTVMMGPWIGLLLTAVTCIVQGLTVSAQSGVIGIIMHFLATGSFVLVAGCIARRQTVKRIIPGLVCGAVTMILVMIPLNLIISPAFMLENATFSAVVQFAKATGKALITFPDGILSVVVGAVAAVCFAVAFMVTVIYTDKTFSVLNIIKGCLVGLIYVVLIILPLNILLGDVAMPGSMAFIRDAMFTVFVPFNAIKAFANAILAYVLYIAVAKRIRLDTTRNTSK